MSNHIGPLVNHKERKSKEYAILFVPYLSVCTHGHVSCSESFYIPAHLSAGLFSASESSYIILKDLNIIFISYGFVYYTYNTLIHLDTFECHIKKHELVQKSTIRNYIISHLLESHHITVETLSPEPIQDLINIIPRLLVLSAT